MSTKIYVGNLSFQSTEGELQQLFSQFGKVVSAEILMDRMTNRSRGFGFVTMENAEEAQNAINSMNGKDVNGRALTVNEARPREERGPRSGGPRGNGGNRGGNRGGNGGNRRFSKSNSNNNSGDRW